MIDRYSTGLWEFFGMTFVTVEQIEWPRFAMCVETIEKIWAERSKQAAEEKRAEREGSR